MLDKNTNPATLTPSPLDRSLFFYILVLFNSLFLCYILTVGYYNRLALDDYAFLGSMNDHGFFSPITFWYFQWQGRFGPQFFINAVLTLYKVIPNLFFYTVLISSLFIWAIYDILKLYFSIPRLLLFNYSILLFSAFLLTTFELNTFYWLNVSTMYFGGILFALIGTVFLLRKSNALYHYFIIAFCLLYVGSSSEHVGAVVSFIIGLIVLMKFYKSGYNFKNFLSHTNNKKILVALSFCLLAFAIMILAPGNKIRMGQLEQVKNLWGILQISYHSSVQLLRYIFFKLPYVLTIVAPFMLLGTYLKDKIELKRISAIYFLVGWPGFIIALIFMGTIPASYAMGSPGPLRSFVFINFILIATLFLICVYVGHHYLSSNKSIKSLSVISIIFLFAFVFYSFRSELPAIKKYNQKDKERISSLKEYKKQKRKETAVLQPLFTKKYMTISDMFCLLTRFSKLPSEHSDMPLFIGDIGEVPSDWRNNHIRHGLGIDFPIVLAPNLELLKSEIDSIKMKATKSFETDKFKFYILDNFIYYQLDTILIEKVPPYIFVRIEPSDKTILKNRKDRVLIYDFIISSHRVKYSGDYSGLKNQMFIKKEITKFPIKKIETGFYNVIDGEVEYSNGMELKFSK